MKHAIMALVLSAITIALFSVSIYATHTISFRDLSHNYEVAVFFGFFAVVYGLATRAVVKIGIEESK